MICWSVDLQETFVIGYIYQAHDHTYKHTYKIIKAYVNPNEKVKRLCLKYMRWPLS